jgi:predicted enzyme related to lactoylglutathione lyase
VEGEVQIHVVMDSQDPERITSFWCELLDMQVAANHADGQHVVLRSTSNAFMLGLQRVPERTAGKNRVHLDVSVEDLDTSTARVESLGGRWIEPGKTHVLVGVPWRCVGGSRGQRVLYL